MSDVLNLEGTATNLAAKANLMTAASDAAGDAANETPAAQEDAPSNG